jgi:hypothetical protein
MNFNFSQALAALPTGAAFMVANQARPPAAYLFATLLPERNSYDYQAKSGSMTVRTTMAGLAAMDSPYAEGGVIDVQTFTEETAKIANRVRLPESALRQLQNMLMHMMINNQPTLETLQSEALNFVDKLIVQAHLDTFEYLRGQALVTGAINWTFNKKTLSVDYGIPAANKLTARTGSGNSYYGTTSKWWDDVKLARKQLKRQIRAVILHPDTLDDIVYNSVNAIGQITDNNGVITITRRAGGTDTSPNLDQNELYRINLIPYGYEGEIFDLANPGQTTKVPFMPRGKVVFVGTDARPRYVVGEGSTMEAPEALGYTHLGPTVEGGGRPGRWADVYTPEQEPWALEGRGVSNGLPVIEAPERVVISTTDMSS